MSKFKVGDEIWWFAGRLSSPHKAGIAPGSLELVHDVITCIDGDTLICWHGTHYVKDIWGKSRQEAWDRLKAELDYAGKLE